MLHEISETNPSLPNQSHCQSIQIWLIGIATFFCLLQVKYFQILFPIVVAGIFLFSPVPRNFKFSELDVLILAITIFWMLSPIWAVCHSPSIRSASFSLTLLGFYLSIRLWNNNKQVTYLSINLFASGVALAETLAIIMFVFHYNEVVSHGFSDSYHLRHLFRPFGLTNNSWSLISILGLAISVLSTKHRFLYSLIATLGTLLTFSRSAVTVVILLTSIIAIVPKFRRLFKSALAGIVTGILIVAAFCPKEVITTLSLTGTPSQQKSISWRIDSSSRALEEFQHNPLLGTGSQSYTMVCNEFDSANSHFTNNPPNILVEIMVEKGAVGLALYIALVIVLLTKAVNPQTYDTLSIIPVLLLMILAKEMGQAILHTSYVASILCVFLIAVYQSSLNQAQTVNLKNSLPIKALGCVILLTVLTPKSVFQNKTERDVAEAMTYIKKGAFPEATDKLYQAIESSPRLDSYHPLILATLLYSQNRFPEVQDMVNHCSTESGYIEFLKGLIKFKSSDTIGGLSHISKALTRIPSIARCQEYKDIDPSLKHKALEKTIVEVRKGMNHGEAITGAILYYHNLREDAESYLNSAVAKNPYLSLPHLLIGDTVTYDYLVHGWKKKTMPTTGWYSDPTLLNIIFHEYSTRYKVWYSAQL